MAAAVRAELRLRGGSTEQLRVAVDDNLASLGSGLRELRASVSRLLSELVEREKALGACAQAGEEEEEDSDDADGEPHPQAKRHRH
ncbi:uncharacterized protein LOC142882034 [Nelusetta ayraudi]|uniref:uncharacterized protein LOC142882034 n=1 Tax=Nelusetta ayraudi TaxID=303726 RepID=UPI003F719CB8